MSSAHFLMHRSPERWTSYSSMAPLFWSEQLGCWMTASRELILSILGDKRFEVVNLKNETRRLSRRLQVDLRATEDLLDKLPLGQEGPQHTATRRSAALAIKKSSDNALKQFAEIIGEKARNAFESDETINIVSEVFAPSVRELMSSLSGVWIDVQDEADSLSQIFDRMLSVNRRKSLNKQIASELARHSTGIQGDDATLRTGLSFVGADSILGALTESFIYEIERNVGKRMSQIEWSDKMPMTGVPYVERIITETAVVADTQIEKGQRVRLYLDAFQPNCPSHPDSYFGAGRHVCLGKALSLNAWRILTAALGRIDKRVHVIDVQYRKSDFLFNTPNIVEVAIDND